MAINIATLQAVLSADISPLLAGLQNAKSGLAGFASDLSPIGDALSGLADAGIGAATAILGFGVDAVQSAAAFQDSTVLLDNAVKNHNDMQIAAGHAANLHSAALVDLADKLSLTTRFSNDQIVAAESLAARFGNISSDAMPQVTQAALDMAAATGGDLQSSMKSIAEAMDDPAQKYSALSRAGVVFTKAQEQQIKTMQASGNMAGAQAIIMGQLQASFGGAAQAAGGDFNGQMDILSNTFNQFLQTIGGLFLPALTNVLGGINQFVGGALSGFKGFIDSIRGMNIGDAIKTGFSDLSSGFGDLLKAIGVDPGTIDKIKGVISTVSGQISGGVQTLVTDVQKIWTGLFPDTSHFTPPDFSHLTQAGQDAITAHNSASDSASPFIVNLQKMIGGAATWLTQNGPKLIGDAISGLFALGDSAFTTVTSSLTTLFNKATTWLQSGQLATTIQNAIESLFQPGDGTSFLTSVKGILDRVGQWLKTEGIPMVGSLLVAAFTLGDTLLTQIGTGLSNAFSDLFKPGGAGDTALKSISTAWDGLWKTGGTLDQVWDGVGTWVSAGLSSAIKGIEGLMTAPFYAIVRDIANLLISAGSAGGIFSGLADAGHSLLDSIPKAAAGGWFPSGTDVMVGEKGPEIVHFGSSGMVVPNNVLGAGSAGSGNGKSGGDIHFHQPVYISGVQDAKSLLNELEQIANGRNMTILKRM